MAVYNGEAFLGSNDDVSSGNVIVGVVLDATPFYAEAGGQAADTGTLKLDGAELTVLDVQVCVHVCCQAKCHCMLPS
jgi:alanyl-tRNA synthetase